MCHTPQIEASKTDGGDYDFEPTFEYVKKILSSADITAGNLETTIGDSNDKFTGYPRFRSPSEFLIALKNSGFDFLFTANNHSIDYGEEGVLKTIKHLKENKIHYTGSFESFSDYDSLRIFEHNGFKICMIAATYGTNGINIPPNKKHLINIINLDTLKNQITKAREKKIDLVIINLHFGDEYSTKPNSFQKMVVDSLISYGADIIIGNHPHTLQPIEVRKSTNSKIDSIVIAYSLGNFLSNQRQILTATGAILIIEIEKELNNDSLKLKDLEVIPTYVFKGKIKSKVDYRIIPITQETLTSDSIKFIDKSFLKKIYNLSKSILQRF